VTPSIAPQPDLLRHSEYFLKDEVGRVAPRWSRVRARYSQRGDFTFRGHRLSSLYRDDHCGDTWLKEPERAPSSFQKYSKNNRANRAALRGASQ